MAEWLEHHICQKNLESLLLPGLEHRGGEKIRHCGPQQL